MLLVHVDLCTLFHGIIKVLFTYDDNDEMVLHQLRKFDGRTVTSAETYLSTSEDSTVDTDEAKGWLVIAFYSLQINL